jgi:hypothetical protein
MSKGTQTNQGNGSQGQAPIPGTEIPEADQPTANPPTPAADAQDQGRAARRAAPKESKVHRLSQEARLHAPQEEPAGQARPGKLTAEQYLREAGLDQGISGLIRSLHRTKVLTFEEWGRQTDSLLRKKTW